MDLRKAIGRNVAALRKRSNYSQEELARLTSLNRQTVWRIETGSTNVGVDTLESLARVLEVEPATLVAGPAAPGSAAEQQAKLLDRMIESLRKTLQYALALRPTLRA
jgi:transcriptional regulator with XRE-family HTH domain